MKAGGVIATMIASYLAGKVLYGTGKAISRALGGYPSKEVEKKIDAIGTVTKDSGDIIKAARTAYDALSDTQKAMVSNVDVLTTAEEAYKKLNSSGNTPNTNDILTGTDKSLSNTKNTSPKTAEEKSLKGTSKTVKTGDTTKMFLPICGIIFTAGMIVVVIRRKRISKR